MNVLFITDKKVGKQMSGLGLRVLELANSLAKENKVNISSSGASFGETWSKFSNSKIIVFQIYYLHFYWVVLAGIFRKRIIVDAYSPFHLEHLVSLKNSPFKLVLFQILDWLRIKCMLALAEVLICASRRQEEMWKHWYWKDKKTIIIPTGIKDSPPRQNISVLKGVIPGVGKDDKVVLWSSGIWPWLDPISAIKAINLVENEQVKLVFYGLQHIDKSVFKNKQPQLAEAIELAKQCGLYNKRVFFVFERTSYAEIGNYLLDADIAINLHFNTLETKYAWRGRLLDYIWAGIPTITTKGDALSEKIAEYGGGIVVNYQDFQSIADAINRLINDRDLNKCCKKGMSGLAEELHWSKVTLPLAEYCLKQVTR